jgi:hypothetical protein
MPVGERISCRFVHDGFSWSQPLEPAGTARPDGKTSKFQRLLDYQPLSDLERSILVTTLDDLPSELAGRDHPLIAVGWARRAAGLNLGRYVHGDQPGVELQGPERPLTSTQCDRGKGKNRSIFTWRDNENVSRRPQFV